MNFIAFLVLLTVGGAAYYEYSLQQQTSDGMAKENSAWATQLNLLQEENQKLQSGKEALIKNIHQAEAQVTALTEQLTQLHQQELAKEKAVAPAPPSATEYENAPLSAGASLGTIATITGKSFQSCKLLKIEPDGITFSHSEGITKVLFPDLSPTDQKRFGYDPSNSAALEDAQLRYQEQLQAAAAAAAAANQAPGR